MNRIRKISDSIITNRKYIRFILHSIFFNFYYLPIKQAIKLPIMLYKPKLLRMKGIVVIRGEVKTGMIKLGGYAVSFYPNSGIVWENHGGICEFNGSCTIGNSSTISIGINGKLEFGDKFCATAALKVACYHSISFANEVLIGWDNIIMDTDLHQIMNDENVVINQPKPIIIDEKVWIGARCFILKGVRVSRGNIIAANTLLTKTTECSNAILGGLPLEVIRDKVRWLK